MGLLFALMEVPHAWCMLMHKFVAVPVDHWSVSPVLVHNIVFIHVFVRVLILAIMCALFGSSFL